MSGFSVINVVFAGCGVSMVLVLMWWTSVGDLFERQTRVKVNVGRGLRVRYVGLGGVLAGLVGVLAGLAAFGPLAAVGVGGVAAVGWWVVAVKIASGRAVNDAADLAEYTSSLANQSTVSATVEDAVERVSRTAVRSMVEPARGFAVDVEVYGVAAAAERFGRMVGTDSARRVAAVVSVAGDGGSGWGGLAEVAQQMATTELETQELFHRRLSSAMIQLVLSVVLSVTILWFVALMMPEVGEWFSGDVGQVILFLTMLLWTVMVGRVAAVAWKKVK